MKEIIEVSELYDVDVVYDPELDKYEGRVLFPEKLAQAQETIAKYGLPKEWEDERKKRKEEQAFWVKGMLSQANIGTHSFLIVVEATDNQPTPIFFNQFIQNIRQRCDCISRLRLIICCFNNNQK